MKIYRASRGAEKGATSSSHNWGREEMEGWKNFEQATGKGKRQVFGIVERVHSWIQYLGRNRKLGKCKRSSWGIWERILVRHGRCLKTRTGRGDIQERRITRKVYGEKIIWMVSQMATYWFVSWLFNNQKAQKSNV